jgi:DNA-binding NarL/FixJ family response regulator
MAPTVLIVDDHGGFRRSARLVLESDGWPVVGEAEDGAGAVEAARLLRPTLVLLDVHLPDSTGFEVAERLLVQEGPPAIVLVSSRDEAGYAGLAARAGALGFIPKADLSTAAIEALLR